MKKLLLITIIAFSSCASSTTCDYNQVKVVEYIDGKAADSNIANDCYNIQTDDMGLIEVSGEQTGKNFYVRYYEDGQALSSNDGEAMNLNRLNVRMGDQLAEYRSKKGDFIVLNKADNVLNLLFGNNAGLPGTRSYLLQYSK